MIENNTYNLLVFCKNCDFRNKIEIPKGTPIEKHPCPNCGIVDLQKDFNSETDVQSYYNFN
jgi:predicted RNA-binding Zn-ribbon protein involved in translation (DUF1610 family)